MQVNLPKVVMGTTPLGNLYKAPSHQEKLSIVKAYIDACPNVPMFDSAGKYGAGLALEELGICLNELGISPNEVLISNKLAWVRKPLTTPEPTFEPGVWHDLKYDAEQKISYQGILDCYENGNELLGNYNSQFASVHDPDEYLDAAINEDDYKKRYDDILEAYRALQDLKLKGIVKGIGIGAKNWRSIEKVSKDVKLDWVMIANSYTIYNHPKELVAFVEQLHQNNVAIINSAVFHGGFLMGSDYFNYTQLHRDNPNHKKYYDWRDRFFELCKSENIEPSVAAIQFGLQVPGIKSIALSSTNPQRVQKNIEMANTTIPSSFWKLMKEHGLIDMAYPHVG